MLVLDQETDELFPLAHTDELAADFKAFHASDCDHETITLVKKIDQHRLDPVPASVLNVRTHGRRLPQALRSGRGRPIRE